MRSLVALAFIGIAAAQKGRQTTEPVYTCPPQFDLIGKTCTRQTTAPATLFCAQGMLQGNQCLLPAQRDAVCPPGTTAAGAGCQMQESVPAERFCPPNTHDIGGECQTYSVTGIVEICARGTLIGGQCEITEQVPALVTKACPVGYEEAKGGCWKHAQMDCTPPHVGKRMLQAHGKGAPLFHGKGMAMAPAPMPVVPRYVPQPAKLAVTSKQCEVKLEAPIATQSTCPGGMEHIGQNCVTKSYEPTTIDCSLGAPHLCFPAQSVQGNLRCPPGFNLQGELCNKVVNIPKNTFCPPGTTEGANGLCMTATAAMPRCPPGLTLAGDMCLGTETVQPTVQVTMTCQGKNCFRH